MGKEYEQFFEGITILPFPEIGRDLMHRTLSYVATRIKIKRLVGLKKETVEKLLRANEVPARYL